MILLLTGMACLDAFPPPNPRLGWPDYDYDGDGLTHDDGDCDDGDPNVVPGSVELCNGIDDDCDGNADTLAEDRLVWFVDADADGLGDATNTVLACDQPDGAVANDDDCDDGNAAVLGPTTFYGDEDRDGYGGDYSAPSCDDLSRFLVTNNEDCNDQDVTIHPATVWHRDADGDGFGDVFESRVVCDPGDAGWVLDARDCDDGDELVLNECAWRDISMSDYFACAVRGNGQPVCWGKDYEGVLAPPEDVRLLTVDVPDRPNTWGRVACGVDESTALVCWGEGDIATDAPTATGFVGVSVGLAHACALDEQGFVTCWGDDLAGEVEQTPTEGGFQQVVAGERMTVALDAAGGIVAWGNAPAFPTLDVSDTTMPPGCAGGGLFSPECDAAVLEEQLGGHTYVAVGMEVARVCGLTTEGEIVCAGDADNLARGGHASLVGPFVRLAVGRSRTCGVDPAGALSCDGSSNGVAADLAQDEGYTHFGTAAHGLADCATWADPTDGRYEIHCWGQNDEGVATPPNEYW